MFDTATSPSMPVVSLDAPDEVLWFARDCRRTADLAEAQLLQAALAWADQHPAESLMDATVLPGADVPIAIAGEGAPLVAEFCIAEFAAGVGMTTEAGRGFVGAAVELRYRLPRTWQHVINLRVPAWRARRIAQATTGLSAEAAAFVDAQVAPFAHKVGPAVLDRLVEEAIGRFMPDLAREHAAARADGRRFEINDHQVSFDGTCDVRGELDLADALDLEAAISAGAEALKAAGSTEALPVRRARAAGELARAQLALPVESDDFDSVAPNGSGEESAGSTACTQDMSSAPRVKSPVRFTPRRVVIYAHLSADALTRCHCAATVGEAVESTTEVPLQVARVENRRQIVTAEQVRAWCGNADTDVVVKPVIDLSEHIHVGAYEAPDRLAEQAQLRDLTCVFPHCNRAARRCDCDHVVEHGNRGGPTCSCNIAPLCRRHHRLKTHSTWRYTVLEPGSYLWSSPHGYQFLRDHEGTRDVTPRERVPRRFEHLYPPPD